MVAHVVAALILDEHNLAEMARHAVSGYEAEEVVWNRNAMVPNPHGEPDSLLLIGETNGGRLLTVPLSPTIDQTTWRPATAFDASRHQRSEFDRRHR